MNQTNESINYLIMYNQPLVGLVMGSILLSFVGYINWYGNVKTNSIKWITSRFFHNEPRGEMSANSLFMVFSSLILAIGGILTVLAFLYLSH